LLRLVNGINTQLCSVYQSASSFLLETLGFVLDFQIGKNGE
jgi:hypothetical protein